MKGPKKQLELSRALEVQKTALLFSFERLRFISAIPFYKRVLGFTKHFTPPPLPEDFFD